MQDSNVLKLLCCLKLWLAPGDGFRSDQARALCWNMLLEKAVTGRPLT